MAKFIIASSKQIMPDALESLRKAISDANISSIKRDSFTIDVPEPAAAQLSAWIKENQPEWQLGAAEQTFRIATPFPGRDIDWPAR